MMSKPTHPKIIARRRHRREKLWKLRRMYIAATSDLERQRILEKAFKIAPTITREQFLAPLQVRGML